MTPNLLSLAVLLVSVLLAGCVQPIREPVQEKTLVAGSLVWPPAPLPPRIRFVAGVSRPMDLGITPPLPKRLKRLISGATDTAFVRPGGVAAVGDIIYVADPGAQSLWILEPEAASFKQVSTAGKHKLVSPVAVAPGGDGRVYVADSYLAKIFVFRSDGKLFATFGGASLQRPAGIAFDRSVSRLYVADSAAHRVWIFSGAGQTIGNIGQRGAGNGEFNYPTHVTVDQNGTLYVTDSLGFRVQMFARDGQFQGAFGHHGDASGDFAAPKGVAVDSDGHVYVVDALFDTVQIFDKAGRLLLSFGERGVSPGMFWLPNGIYIDCNDRIYVADSYNQRIQIFQYLGRRQQ